MSSHRPFRFGVQARDASNRADWIGLAQRAEAHGYDVLSMPDHFDIQLAPISALMAAADATSTLRIGALVWDNDYRHPVVFAKELATIDLLSEGRLEIGLGAGWMITDYEQSGIPYDSPKVRIDRMVEGLAVIKGVMGEGPFSFSGEHYTITNHDGYPKPVQSPCPPILIGGGGKRVLTIAAREADIVGVNATLTSGAVGRDTLATVTAPAVDEKVAIVRAAAGERIDSIDLNVRVFVLNVTDDRAGTIAALSQTMDVGPEFVDSPYVLVGSVDEIVEQLQRNRDRWGFNYIIVGGEHLDMFAPVVAALAGR